VERCAEILQGSERAAQVEENPLGCSFHRRLDWAADWFWSSVSLTSPRLRPAAIQGRRVTSGNRISDSSNVQQFAVVVACGIVFLEFIGCALDVCGLSLMQPYDL
jgi:hypothetical protein